MAYATLVRRSQITRMPPVLGLLTRSYKKLALGSDVVSAAPDATLQKLMGSDKDIMDSFSITPLGEIFKGKKVVAFGHHRSSQYDPASIQMHVPGYKNSIDKFKAKGIDSVICVMAEEHPVMMNFWAEKFDAKHAIEFYCDVDGCLSEALLGPGFDRWSAYVEDGKVKVLNVEEHQSEVKVSGAEVILGQI